MQYGSLQNKMQGAAPRPGEAEHQWNVGDGATTLWFTDRHAYTVVEVVSPTHIRLQRDRATFEPGSMGTSVSEYAADPEGEVLDAKFGSAGWRTVNPRTGRYGKKAGNRVITGRSEYSDPHF